MGVGSSADTLSANLAQLSPVYRGFRQRASRLPTFLPAIAGPVEGAGVRPDQGRSRRLELALEAPAHDPAPLPPYPRRPPRACARGLPGGYSERFFGPRFCWKIGLRADLIFFQNGRGRG